MLSPILRSNLSVSGTTQQGASGQFDPEVEADVCCCKREVLEAIYGQQLPVDEGIPRTKWSRMVYDSSGDEGLHRNKNPLFV